MKESRFSSLVTILGVCIALGGVASNAAAQSPRVRAEQKISLTEGGFSGPFVGGWPRFGSALANLGDLDGDGVTELAVGAPYESEGGLEYGAVWILFLNDDGTVKSSSKLGQGLGGFSGTLGERAHFGSSMAAMGDFDGNGTSELLVQGADKAWLLFLSSSGTVLSSTELDLPSGLYALGAASDLDGDGLREVVVSVPGPPRGSWPTGFMCVKFLDATGAERAQATFSGAAYYWISMVNPGDLDGDGIGDLAAIDAYSQDLWVWILNADGTPRLSFNSIRPDDSPYECEFFGSSLTSVGDINHDGLNDLIIGTWGFENLWCPSVPPDYLRTAHLIPSSVVYGSRIGPGLAGFVGAMSNESRFGSALVNLGDLDGDGHFDLAAGAPYDSDGGPSTGSVWILFTDCAGAQANRRKGFNSAVLDTGGTLPTLGQSWELTVDATGHAPGPLLIGAWAYPSSGVFLPGGELLVDLKGPRYQLITLAHNGGIETFQMAPIPNTPALCGILGTFQAAIFGGPSWELTTAVDMIFGH
jgi:hypothetical protein